MSDESNHYTDQHFYIEITVPTDGPKVLCLEIKRALYRFIEEIESEDAIRVIEN